MPKRSVTFRFSEVMLEALGALSEQSGWTRTQVIEGLVMDAFTGHKVGPGRQPTAPNKPDRDKLKAFQDRMTGKK